MRLRLPEAQRGRSSVACTCRSSRTVLWVWETWCRLAFANCGILLCMFVRVEFCCKDFFYSGISLYVWAARNGFIPRDFSVCLEASVVRAGSAMRSVSSWDSPGDDRHWSTGFCRLTGICGLLLRRWQSYQYRWQRAIVIAYLCSAVRWYWWRYQGK